MIARTVFHICRARESHGCFHPSCTVCEHHGSLPPAQVHSNSPSSLSLLPTGPCQQQLLPCSPS